MSGQAAGAVDGLGRFTSVVFPAGQSNWLVDIASALGPIAVTSVVVRWRKGETPRNLKVETQASANAPWQVQAQLDDPNPNGTVFGDESRIELSGVEVSRLRLSMVRVQHRDCDTVARGIASLRLRVVRSRRNPWASGTSACTWWLRTSRVGSEASCGTSRSGCGGPHVCLRCKTRHSMPWPWSHCALAPRAATCSLR